MLDQGAWQRVLVGSHSETEAGGIDVPVCPEEVAGQDRDQHEVEDTVVDEFGVGRDDVAPFRNTPTDRIQAEEGPEEAGGDIVDAEDVQAESIGVLAGKPDQVVADQEPGEEPEHIVGPLIV